MKQQTRKTCSVCGSTDEDHVKHTVIFLDYAIVNSGNSDGWVITKPTGDLWECHLGNFDNLDKAKLWAVRYFMISRASIFAHGIARRMGGLSGTYHEWFLFEQVVKKAGLIMPEELHAGDGSNFMIYFKGKKV